MTPLSLAALRQQVDRLRLPDGVNAMIVGRDPANLIAATIVGHDRDLSLLLYGIEDGLAVCPDLTAGQRVAILAPAAHQRALTLLVERASSEVVATMSVGE